jgi:hypothetical protein
MREIQSVGIEILGFFNVEVKEENAEDRRLFLVNF